MNETEDKGSDAGASPLPSIRERDWSKLRIEDGCIHFFVYSQDGTKVPWKIADTHPNRLFVDWLQVHDSPTTGHDIESVAKRAKGAAPAREL